MAPINGLQFGFEKFQGSPPIILAIDPGVGSSGWALFVKGQLVSCGFDDNDKVMRHMVTDARAALVIERPQADGRLKGVDPQDVLNLSLVVGVFLGVARSMNLGVGLYMPREWKGQLPKEVTTERAKATLAPYELSRVPKMAKKKLHNTWDAIALGLFALKRKSQKRQQSAF
jgi:hypothetical protein